MGFPGNEAITTGHFQHRRRTTYRQLSGRGRATGKDSWSMYKCDTNSWAEMWWGSGRGASYSRASQ